VGAEQQLTAAREQALRSGGATIRKWRDYAKPLFHNVYNYTLLAGVVAASVLTQNWALLLLGIGLEVVWMINAPDNKALRRRLDTRFDAQARSLRALERERRIEALPPKEAKRCRALLGKRSEIVRLAGENSNFESVLLAPELEKLDELVDAFIELSHSACRQAAYLQKEDVGDIERQRKVYERALEGGGPADDLNRQNLGVVMRRLEILQELRDFLIRSHHQIALIESNFALIADQIVSMRTPQELGRELDVLTDGVQAIRDTERMAEQALGNVTSLSGEAARQAFVRTTP
jgi:hypothetical protein